MNEWEWQLLEDKTPVECLPVGALSCGPVLACPAAPAQGRRCFDMALEGKIATIECIEQDYEGKFHFAVVLDDDPGRDMGMLRQPGHRFFFDPEEVEPAQYERAAHTGRRHREHLPGRRRVRRRSSLAHVAPRAAGLRARGRFGIRGLDLAYALLDGYDLAILVDAAGRGGDPGTLYVLEPELGDADAGGPATGADGSARHESHARAGYGAGLGWAAQAGAGGGVRARHARRRIEGAMGLSAPVEAAVGGAIAMVESLIAKSRRSCKQARPA
jgi:hypothetical protein